MVRGVRIILDGSFERFNYNVDTMINRNLDLMARERGLGDMVLLEMWDNTDGDTYIMYGWDAGYNFNHFELEYVNACGDILVVCINNNTELPKDVETLDIYDHFRPVELGEFVISDEMSYDIGEYDMTDGFIVEDTDSEDIGYF